MSSAFSAQSIANQAELAMTAEIRQPRAKEYLLLPEGVRQLDASEKPFFQQLYFKTTHYSSEIDETGELWCQLDVKEEYYSYKIGGYTQLLSLEGQITKDLLSGMGQVIDELYVDIQHQQNSIVFSVRRASHQKLIEDAMQAFRRALPQGAVSSSSSSSFHIADGDAMFDELKTTNDIVSVLQKSIKSAPFLIDINSVTGASIILQRFMHLRLPVQMLIHGVQALDPINTRNMQAHIVTQDGKVVDITLSGFMRRINLFHLLEMSRIPNLFIKDIKIGLQNASVVISLHVHRKNKQQPPASTMTPPSPAVVSPPAGASSIARQPMSSRKRRAPPPPSKDEEPAMIPTAVAEAAVTTDGSSSSQQKQQEDSAAAAAAGTTTTASAATMQGRKVHKVRRLDPQSMASTAAATPTPAPPVQTPAPMPTMQQQQPMSSSSYYGALTNPTPFAMAQQQQQHMYPQSQQQQSQSGITSPFQTFVPNMFQQSSHRAQKREFVYIE